MLDSSARPPRNERRPNAKPVARQQPPPGYRWTDRCALVVRNGFRPVALAAAWALFDAEVEAQEEFETADLQAHGGGLGGGD